MEPPIVRDEWYVIVNPNAGKGKGKKDWQHISVLLNKYKIIFSEVFTTCKGCAITLTQNAIREGYRRFICIGGDGTLNEIVNGAFMNNICKTTEITVALIPVGTGNDWGRMYGIPSDYEGAVTIISQNKEMLQDIGFVSFFSGAEKKDRYFINIAGLGFESAVVNRTNYQKEHGHGGKLIYFYNLLISLITYKNCKAEIEINGEKIKSEIFSLNVGNGRYCGGGMQQTPNALPNDGILDVTVINGIGKLEIIRNLKILYDGTILSHPKIKGYKTTHLKVTSTPAMYCEADGESLGHTPAEFSIVPSAIKVIYGTEIIQ